MFKRSARPSDMSELLSFVKAAVKTHEYKPTAWGIYTPLKTTHP